MDAPRAFTQRVDEKLDGIYIRIFEQILEATLHKVTAVRPLDTYLTNHQKKKKTEHDKTLNAGDGITNSLATFSYGLLHMDTPVNRSTRTYTILSVWTLDEV